MKKMILIAGLILGHGIAGAQTVGVAAVGSLLNTPQFATGAGAGLWLTMPLGRSAWSVGSALSYAQSKQHYSVGGHFHSPGPAEIRLLTNRLYSASLIIPRQLITTGTVGFSLGPSIGYSSIGAKPATVMADRIFMGAWAGINYKLADKLRLELVLHPRFSPAGNGGVEDAYSPFSQRNLLLSESWLGVSYTFGKGSMSE